MSTNTRSGGVVTEQEGQQPWHKAYWAARRRRHVSSTGLQPPEVLGGRDGMEGKSYSNKRKSSHMVM